MNRLNGAMAILACSVAFAACGGDKKDSAERDKEVQKVIQEGMKKEQSLYEGMQKNVETLEKKVEEQTKKK